jgi:hypothetical protein
LPPLDLVTARSRGAWVFGSAAGLPVTRIVAGDPKKGISTLNWLCGEIFGCVATDNPTGIGIPTVRT